MKVAGSLAIGLAVALASPASAQSGDVKIGMLLPFSQVFAVYGNAIMEGFELALEEAGNKAGGRNVAILKEDDKNDPKTAVQIVRKYTKDDNVDFIVGPVGSHIVAAVRDDIHRSKTFLVVANAGNNDVTGSICSPYIVRTSFSNWQINYPMGLYAAEAIGKTAYTVAANYDAGQEMQGAFKQGFVEKGGKAPIEEWPALGTADFAPTITNARGKLQEIDTIWSFMPGGSTPRFINQMTQSGMRDKVKLTGPVFMADELFFPAMGDSAVGVIGSGHYVASIDTPRNKAFQEAFRKKYNKTAHVVNVQGYDSARLILAAANSLKGDLRDKDKVRKAIIDAEIDSPRGYLKIDPKTGNLVQNVYITEVIKRPDGSLGHKVLRTYDKVTDAGAGCKMM